jgi:hypothetical protein
MNKNFNKLFQTALEIEAEEAKQAGALGYMARALVQATMPHKKQTANEFIRKNGAFTLSILAPSKIGLPYGVIPRLLMAWVTTDAIRNKCRVLSLGDSLSGFMQELGLVPTGGRWGTITRLKDQIRRLFTSSISCSYTDNVHESELGFRIADCHDLWWDPKSPDQCSLFESTVTLSAAFYQEVISRPVPIDVRVLKVLSRSPLAIDIYCWLTYRMSYLNKKIQIPWQTLQIQFGSDYAGNVQGTRDFKRAFLRELKKIDVLYRDANLETNDGCLVLLPSKPHILKK